MSHLKCERDTCRRETGEGERKVRSAEISSGDAPLTDCAAEPLLTLVRSPLLLSMLDTREAQGMSNGEQRRAAIGCPPTR